MLKEPDIQKRAEKPLFPERNLVFPSPLHVGLNTSAETREKLVPGKCLVFCLHLFVCFFFYVNGNKIPERNLVFPRALIRSDYVDGNIKKKSRFPERNQVFPHMLTRNYACGNTCFLQLKPDGNM